MTRETWRVGDSFDRFLLDLAADRTLRLPTDPPSLEQLDLANRHGLIALVAAIDQPAIKADAWPVYVRHLSRQRVMEGTLGELLIEFARAGIRASILKGPYLDRVIYRRQGIRTYTDVDVLVEREQLAEALAVLERHPFVARIPPKVPKADKRDILVCDPSGVRFNLDLHWDLFSYSQLRGSAAGATEDAWKRAEPDPDGVLGPAWDLPAEARVAFLCSHALLDHRFRLILYRDLVEFAHHGIPWEALVRFSRDWRLRSTTYLALLIARHVLGAEVPPEALAELRPGGTPLRVLERLLPTTNLVRFDGHRPRPVNLAMVLLHDDFRTRLGLAARAPRAFPHWFRRVSWTRTRAATEDRTPAVLVVLTTNQRRGGEVFGEQLAGGLGKLGWRTKVVALADADREPRVAVAPVARRRRRDLGRANLDVIFGLRKAIKQHRPDLVFANGGGTLRYCLMAMLGLRRRSRLVYGSIGEPRYWARTSLARRLVRLQLSRTDLVTCVSEATRRQVVSFGLAPDRVKIANTGVPDLYAAARHDPSGSPLRVLFVGSLSPEKDPLMALEVTALAARHHPISLRVVGAGPLRRELEERSRKLGLKETVTFVGAVADLSPQLAWADVLVLTSRTEGLPGVVLEAAAAAVPTVAFEVGGIGEVVVHGVTGCLAPAGDAAALAAELVRLVGRPELIAGLGAAARRRYEEGFTLEASVRRYSELLAATLMGG